MNTHKRLTQLITAFACLFTLATTFQPIAAHAQLAACSPGYTLRAVRGSLKRCVLAKWAVGGAR